MPTNLKRLVNARMKKTGESHATALRYVRRKGEKIRIDAAARADAAAPATRRWHYRGTVPHDPRIDAYARSVPEPFGGLIASLVALVRRSVPDHDEVVTHGAPQFCIAGEPFCYVVGYSKHVNLGFCDGASLPDPSGLLEGTGKAMRHVKMKREGSASSAALAALVTAAARRVRTMQAADAKRPAGVRDDRR